jgi:hypothetical protein
MPTVRPLTLALCTLLATHALPSVAADDGFASFAIDTDVKLSSDQRTRGISDSLNRPGLKLSMQAAHESGLVGLLEISTVSKKQFLDGNGLAVTLAGGYRFGDPEGWHFGAGVATEIFPGAKFDAPHGFDLQTGTPTDLQRTRYDSVFAVAEIGHGALEGRLLNVVSKTYRGADTGGVCGTLLALNPDPTRGLACYARGDHDSRGTWLADLDYKFDLGAATTLNLHAGYQKVAHFKEADFSDLRMGLTHKHWGFEWSADWVSTRTRADELYLAVDGSKLRATDDDALVVSVSRRF